MLGDKNWPKTSSRFSYAKYDDVAMAKQETFKQLFEQIEESAECLLEDSRSKSLLMTKMEEAYMWVGKAIRDEQIERNLRSGAPTPHLPERSAS